MTMDKTSLTPTAGVNEEVRRSFTPTGNRRRRTIAAQPTQSVSAKSSKKGKIITKTIYLLNNDMTSVPTDRSDMYSYGRVVNCVNISTDLNETGMEELINEIFNDKLKNIPKPSFKFVKAERNRIFVPKTHHSTVWDGETVSKLCGTGNLYIMANGDVEDLFDSDMYRKKRQEKEDSSSDDELPIISLRSTATSTVSAPTEPNTYKCDSLTVVTVESEDEDLIKEKYSAPKRQSDGLTVESEDEDLIKDKYSAPKRQRIDDEDMTIDSYDLLSQHVLPMMSVDPSTSQKLVVSRIRPFRSYIRSVSGQLFTDNLPIEIKFFDSLNTVDDGGPRREFLARLLNDICSAQTGIFQRTDFDGAFTVTHNARKLDDREYYWVGRALASIVVYGGPPTTILSPALYDCISKGFDDVDPDIKDIPVKAQRLLIEKIKAAKSEDEINLILNTLDPITMEEGTSLLLCAGISAHLKLADVPQVTRRAIKYYALGLYRSELEQFISGIRHHGILQLIQNNPKKCKKLFLASQGVSVTADEILLLFQPSLSPEGMNYRRKEEDLMEHWANYLGDVAMGITLANPQDIMRFASGMETIPIIGWGTGREPSLTFDHEPRSRFPESRTCGPTIILPLWDYQNYASFKAAVDEAIIGSPTILLD